MSCSRITGICTVASDAQYGHSKSEYSVTSTEAASAPSEKPRKPSVAGRRGSALAAGAGAGVARGADPKPPPPTPPPPPGSTEKPLIPPHSPPPHPHFRHCTTPRHRREQHVESLHTSRLRRHSSSSSSSSRRSASSTMRRLSAISGVS